MLIQRCVVLHLWTLGFILDVTLVSAKSKWTQWYNTDTPYDGTEMETIDRVKKKDDGVCDDGVVGEAECRDVGTGLTFKNQRTFGGNNFLIPCNATGLLCRDRDQPGEVFCSDYEIRYLCHDDEASTIYDGGFIAMAAGLSVIVPLICVLIVQLKRAKTQRNRANARADQTNQDTTPTSNYADPPPTYEELFGDHATLERYDSTAGLLPDRNNHSAHGRESVSSVESQSDLSVSTISGELVDDPPIVPTGIVNPAMDSVNIENEIENRPRRLLGMHISIHDLFNYSEPVLTTPPPTYNEALEILKTLSHNSQKLSEVQT